MDLDLITNGTSIKQSINSLLAGKISWLVLGYERDKILGVIETGDDSLEDMFEEFHGSKVMYGFASVIDPNSKLKKNVYFYWQGSGASQVMKTTSIQHSNVIRDLCKPIHVTITARDTQDLDLKDVMLKVSSASGANYSFHNEQKQIYETQPSIKSEGNTANMYRQERQKELASLSGLKKKPDLIQKVNTNGTRNEPIQSIKPAVFSKPSFQKPTSSYAKINPEKELQALSINKKTTYESAARVQSENNTADRAKEDRQKELSQLMNRTYNNDAFQQVGTNYTKINPIAEMQKLRKQSQSMETENSDEFPKRGLQKINPAEEITRLRRESIPNDDYNPTPVNPSYKKIDPLSEIRALRETHQLSESNEAVSPGSVYKKINPSEEIKNLKSQTTSFPNTASQSASSYKKINPMEEIKASKNNSYSPPIIEETKATSRIVSGSTDNRSARMTFENIHKKDDSHKRLSQENKTRPTAVAQTAKTTTEIESYNTNHFNFVRNDNDENNIAKSDVVKTPIVNKVEEPIQDRLKSDPKEVPANILKVDDHSTKTGKTAVAMYEYQASDNDEISFNVGDLITDIEEIDDDWWIGCDKNSIKGMFPSNYVELCLNNNLPPEVKADVEAEFNKPLETSLDDDHNEVFDSSAVNNDTSLTVVAQYTYSAQEDDELSFVEGDHIFNVNKIDDGWWEGEMQDGSKGMFPANYVVIV